jgi:hypothetical protein
MLQNQSRSFPVHPLLDERRAVFSAQSVISWSYPLGGISEQQLASFVPKARECVFIMLEASPSVAKVPPASLLKTTGLDLSFRFKSGRRAPVEMYINPKWYGKAWETIDEYQPLLLFVLGRNSSREVVASKTFLAMTKRGEVAKWNPSSESIWCGGNIRINRPPSRRQTNLERVKS